MLIRHYCYYLTDWNDIQARQEDWDSNKVVKCLKGREITGYADIGIDGLAFRLDERSKAEFLARLWGVIGRNAARQLTTQAAIVPIPNSSGVVGSTSKYRTLSFAEEIAGASSGKLIAQDCLRWRSEIPAVHTRSGHRSPEQRYKNLVAIAKPTLPVLVFDDVITSGSSFVAAVWRLSELGVTPFEGLVVARRTAVQKPRMFLSEKENLPIPQKPMF